MLADRLLATLDGPEVLDHPSEDHTQTVALVKMFGRCYDTRTLFHLSLRGAGMSNVNERRGIFVVCA